jgi:uncharacterized membrane protein
MNSASVILGAMVISALLYSVIFGVTTCRGDWRTFLRAVGTFTIGFFAAVAAADAINLLHPTTFQTELLDRLSASARDYAVVAFFSGVAGTYAFLLAKNSRGYH